MDELEQKFKESRRDLESYYKVHRIEVSAVQCEFGGPGIRIGTFVADEDEAIDLMRHVEVTADEGRKDLRGPWSVERVWRDAQGSILSTKTIKSGLHYYHACEVAKWFSEDVKKAIERMREEKGRAGGGQKRQRNK